MNTIEGFFVNWKTSLLGIVAGAFTALQGGQNWKSVAAGAAIAVLGLVAKDNTTHSTQTQVAQATAKATTPGK
jgi:hypothetical protein